MTQFHGVRTKKLFVNLQSLNPINIYPDASDLKCSRVITENHFIAPLDANEIVGGFEYLQEILELFLVEGRNIAAFGRFGRSVLKIRHEVACAHFQGRSVTITSKYCCHFSSRRRPWVQRLLKSKRIPAKSQATSSLALSVAEAALAP